ncbi:hypothetical protein S2L_55 [Cyanophage S-2L]|nr:hypothetical protein S2L_55 [Cyanophage S-2L]
MRLGGSAPRARRRLLAQAGSHLFRPAPRRQPAIPAAPGRDSAGRRAGRARAVPRAAPGACLPSQSYAERGRPSPGQRLHALRRHPNRLPPRYRPMTTPRKALLQTTRPDTSDGHHTFRELYAHRYALFLLLIKWAPVQAQPWWSRKHHLAGPEMYPNQVVAGLELPNGPITYHLPVRYIPHLKAAGAVELSNAPQWNGHTTSDVEDLLLLAVNDGDPLEAADAPA